MRDSTLASLVDRQLLLQLGDRLHRLRKAQGLSTVAMAERAGLSRSTLRSIETGDPGTAIGAYVRVMSVLGLSGELALLADDTAPAGSAAALTHRDAPAVQVHVTAQDSRHRMQDLQSLFLHEEMVRRVKADPTLVAKARTTTERWLRSGDPRSASLWREWLRILEAGAWRKVLRRTGRAQQLRQASPLVSLMPADVRRRILRDVSSLRAGVVLRAERRGRPD